ncbi:MAG: hypothetical protein ACI4JY_07725 [Oscillospiraceae bacterium]
MATQMNSKEKQALNQKIKDPNLEVKCPRCGNEILYKEYSNGCTVYCKTDGCIKGNVRGI